MASFRKPAANKQLKSPFASDVNSSDAKFKGRGLVAGGIIVPNRIFVGGICPKATPDDLAALFRKYGAVTAIKIVADQNGLSKGYGFVTFEKADDVSKLQCDAENLYINNKQLNIAPAIMKQYPQNIGRYPDSIVMPLPPNLYFTNGLQYQYSEAAPVYPNSSYTPQVAVLPTVSDAAYYSTPYHGTALFYPLSPSTPQIVVGSHQPYSSYQPMHSNNSNYAYSSQTSQTTSPASSTGKTSSSLNAPSNTINATDMHVSHGTPIMTNMPPNMTSLPPPVPYPVSHPPQYYNGSVMPQFAGDMYYNMVPGTCYPMMTVNGQDTYVPYYEVGEACNANIPSECHLICAQETNMEAPHTYSISVPSQPPYQPQQQHSEAINGGKESSPPTANGPNSEPVKALVPLGPPPVTAAEHIPAEHPYGAENTGANSAGGGNVGNSNAAANSGGHAHGHHSGSGGSATPLTQQPPLAAPPPPPPQQQIAPPPPPPLPPHVDYNSSAAAAAAFIHRSTATTAIISPYPPIPQQNLYFNSVYMSEATSASLVGPCPYSKNLSEHYVSDHLPKRDIKHTPKKFNGGVGGANNGPTPLVSHSGGNGGAGNGSVNGNGAGANHHQQPPQQQQPHHHSNGQNGGGSLNGNHNSMKDQPPNIPKFPFLVNNNYPGFVNRNMKEKDYKSGGGMGGGGPKGLDSKPLPRPPRNNSLGGGGNGGGSFPPKPRVFHNQSQYAGAGGPPRSQRIDRNGHMVPNLQYSRSGPPVMSRQNSYDQPQPNPYDYANNHHHAHYHHHHQGHPASYIKHMGYESHPRRYHPGNNSGGYRGYNKHERSNGAGNEAAAYHHRNSNPMDEPRPRKYHNQHDEGMAAAPPTATTTATGASSSVVVATNIEHAQPEQSATPVSGNVQSQQQLQQSQPPQQGPPQQQVPPSQQPPPQQQLCAEMQKLAV